MQVHIDRMDHFGNGIGNINGKIIFVKGALTGETVDVTITKDKKSFMEGTINTIIYKSSKRVEPFCNYFGVCGGCSLCHLNYENTLEYKKESGFKVGKVLTCEEHPDSDHMHVLTVDIGSEVLDIVCGAPNVKEGQKVVVATLGTTMFDGKKIVPSSLRGIKSNGMLCSPRELHLEGAPNVRGILVLDDDAIIGEDFFKNN